jgi:hypothetical protein
MDATIILYLKCIGGLLVSLVIHTLVKFNEAQELFAKGNVEELTLKAFLRKKPLSHLLNLICALSWLLFLPDIIRAHPVIYGSAFYANIVHILACMVVGYANSSIMLKLLGSGTKYAIEVIDKKTNIADGK